ncbi:MAG TPA: DinB family protein [Daejeonella sp.]|nr:DinB family protein [Daejeonella sp.]
MKTEQSPPLVHELIQLITHGNAHAPLEEALEGLRPELRCQIPEKLPYSIWQVLEHIRITQWDIVEFCLSASHQSPKWPDGYWTAPVKTVDDKIWKASLAQIQQDRERFLALLRDPEINLFKPFAHGEGQNLFREALLIADHNSYHIGQIIIIRRLLGNWG